MRLMTAPRRGGRNAHVPSHLMAGILLKLACGLTLRQEGERYYVADIPVPGSIVREMHRREWVQGVRLVQKQTTLCRMHITQAGRAALRRYRLEQNWLREGRIRLHDDSRLSDTEERA